MIYQQANKGEKAKINQENPREQSSQPQKVLCKLSLSKFFDYMYIY